MEASGVRRSWETARSSAVRSSLAWASALGGGRLGLELAAVEGDGQLVGEGPQDVAVLAAQVGAVDGEDGVVVQERRCRSPARAARGAVLAGGDLGVPSAPPRRVAAG